MSANYSEIRKINSQSAKKFRKFSLCEQKPTATRVEGENEAAICPKIRRIFKKFAKKCEKPLISKIKCATISAFYFKQKESL